MKRIQYAVVAFGLILPLASCANYNAYQAAKTAEIERNWDAAVTEYEKALQIDPGNRQFKISLERAKLEASRGHFEKGKSLRAAVDTAVPSEQLNLMQLAATEFELTVRLDPTNQYAAVELDKAVRILTEAKRASGPRSIEEVKAMAAERITKAQPPTLNPASSEPISLSFPRETPVKDIYRALGNAFGINILFDQGVKDDRIVIELRDVTAQQALERVMQAANHFYKVLDEKSIIVVPDNAQSRRDYEDLVIQTFYLSNGDAEQVSNVLRTMLEARSVFPVKNLNAITIRDTADKVRIAAKIIEANDKARAEVVVDVELVQLDLNKTRDIGMSVAGFSNASPGAVTPFLTDKDGKRVPITAGTISDLRSLGSLADGNFSVSIPTVTYALLKSLGNSELLANPELRISEGEKATLHIGQRIPVPVSTFTSVATGGTQSGTYAPVTSYQYQDVGIKVSMEPRVHHNREVTLKLTVEVSNQGPSVEVSGQPPQPTFATRTIESTIRLKDGETNFLAGLIQSNREESSSKTPFVGDLPVIGRLFTRNHRGETRTDLVLTMTPHIIRIPDISEDDLSPMWVGTQNNITFRGVSPRIESQSAVDPFTSPAPRTGAQYGAPNSNGRASSIQGGGPANPFGTTTTPQPGPNAVPQPQPPSKEVPPMLGTPTFPNPESSSLENGAPSSSAGTLRLAATSTPASSAALLRLTPRLSPQPVSFSIKGGEQKNWTLVGMDLDGLGVTQLVLRYNPNALTVLDVLFGPAVEVNPAQPPIVTISKDTGTVKITSSNGKPLAFRSGGEVLSLRLIGASTGESPLVLESVELKDASGTTVPAAVSGGQVRVE
jgi:general secretion pathway protein D